MSWKNTQILVAPTVIAETCGETPDLTLIKDSLAPYKRKPSLPGTILHNLPYLEVLVTVQKEKIHQLYENACKYLGSKFTMHDARDFSDGLISLIECECQIGEEGLLVYQFVESRAIERFCGLSGELIWREQTRSQNVKEFFGFKGERIEVPLKVLECTGSKTRYSMPPLSKGFFYGCLRTSLFLPAIIIQNQNRAYETLHEKTWRAAIGQLAKEISPINASQPYLLNTFDIYHKNKEMIPSRLKRYLSRKSDEYMRAIGNQII